MFDQERFDELARGLATNRLSRRQVLKSFAASLLLAGPLGALRNRAVSAQQPATGTAAPCADDPVTSASLGAAGSALAAGATQVKLSPKGCVRYRRTLKGGSVTSEEVTLEGKTALVWKHTSTKSTGRRDADLNGFFEWRSKVHRGAATKKDDRTVTTEYSAATKKLTRRETYTRGTGKGWRVLIQEADQSGTLRTTAKFNTGPYVAAGSKDQGSAGDFAQRPSEYSAGVQKAKPGVSGLKTIGCRGHQTELKASLRGSRDALIKCLQAYGAGDLAVLSIINYYARPIVITCASPSSGQIEPDDRAFVDPDSATMQDWTVRITVNKDTFFQHSQAEQISDFGHEMLHLNGGTFLHDKNKCNETCQKDPVSGPHHDRTYACEDLCFGENPTKCSCDLCLGTPPGLTGQNCNERCKSLATCPYPDAEERCTFDTQPGTGGSGAPKKPCSDNQKYTQACYTSAGKFIGCCTPGSICCDPPGPQATSGCPGGGCCGDPARTYCCNGCCCAK